jgi:O-antigen/teichoic acid export membrane protein
MSNVTVSLRTRVFKAGAWSLAGYAISFVIRFGSNLVMTRLLMPSMFGVAAIAQLIMAGLSLFSDVGLRPSVIQSKRGDDPVFLNTVWTTQVLRGFLLWFAGSLISILIYLASRFGWAPEASVYGNPTLPYVVAAISMSAIVSGFESTKTMEAGRTLSLGKLTKIDIASQIIGLLAMIGWAIVSPSVWSLVAGGIASSAARTVISHLWLPGVKNRWQFEREAFREIINFGKWIFLSSILFFFASNGDRLILGGLVDASELGTYVVAFLLLSSIDQILVKIIVDVSFPALSEIVRGRPTELTKAYYKFHALVASVAYFSCGALFVSSEAVVRLFYDARYQQAGWILQALSIALLTIPIRIATQTFLALGVERVYFYLNATRIVALFCALPLGFYLGGLPGAVWGIVLSYFANMPMAIVYAWRYRMFDLRRELLSLLVLVPAVVIGEIANPVLDMLTHLLRYR